MITNYSELQSAINDWLDDSELSGHVTTFISLGEARHKREIRIREMQARDTLTLSEGSDIDTDRFLSLSSLDPTFLDVKYVRIKVPTTTSGKAFYPPLQELSLDELTDRMIKDGARPEAFAIWGEQIEFDCMADQDYTVDVLYYQSLTALSDANTTNALLTRAPDVYLYSALSATAPFLMDDPRLTTWETLYREARDALNRSEIEHRRSGPLVSKVKGLPR